MPRRTKLHLNHIEKYDVSAPFEGLTYVLRTDAHHATRTIKKALAAEFNNAARAISPAKIRHDVHQAYRLWGHQVLKTLANHLDYNNYGLTNPQNRYLNVHFYNARTLAESAVQKGVALVNAQSGNPQSRGDRPVLFVSMDDMITKQTPHWGELAFSRQFDPETAAQITYRARPGYRPLDEQLATLKKLAAGFEQRNGYKMPVVLLEDNVRRASMMNTIIGMTEKSGLYDHAELIGISTCFCCADAAELQKIRNANGQVVPVTSVVDYGGAKIDVATPRDLLFDGYVVGMPQEGENTTTAKTGRLPAIFMDAATLFKVNPDKADVFNRNILDANIKFCERLERKFRTAVRLGWFAGAEAISHYTGHHPDTPMIDVLRANDNVQKQRLLSRAP